MAPRRGAVLNLAACLAPLLQQAKSVFPQESDLHVATMPVKQADILFF